jgi:hypothetical protein
MKRSLSLIAAKRPSSNRYGAQSAAAKGHPRIPPRANQAIPCDDFKPPRQFMKAAAPSILIYMAKLEGRNAVLAWKFPGLRTVAARKIIAIREFNVVLMIRHSHVWHKAQRKANA